jgi:hypothetical protein
MQSVFDFLVFDRLISHYALIVFYYLGALGMPLAAWLLARYLLVRFPSARDAFDAGKRGIGGLLNVRQRVLLLALFFSAFLFMELLWRMLFEYLIAFMQMRDALIELTGQAC